MTKWFDTNYHYIVPELGPDTSFSLSSTKPFDEHAEAMEELGIDTVPVIVGPVSFLLLGKSADGVPEDFDRLGLLEPLLEVYGEVIERLGRAGRDLGPARRALLRRGPLRARARRAAARLRGAGQGPRAHPDPASRPTSTTSATPTACCATCPIEGIGLDFHRGGRLDRAWSARAKNVELIADEGGLEDKWLFAGIVDGRNVWINELEHSLDLLGGLRDRCAELVVSTSCSLLHTPVDLDAEPPSDVLDDELRSWMAFAKQKVGEVATLARGPRRGPRGDRRRARRQRPGARGPAQLPPHPQPGGARRGSRRSTDEDARAPEPVRGAPRGPARPPRPAALPDHDDRLLPADGRDPPGARRASRGQDRPRPSTSAACAPRSSA